MEKKCKYCAMMISKEAKICPHCRKKQGMTLLGKIIIGFFLFILLCIFVSEIGKQPGQRPSSQQKPATDQYNANPPDYLKKLTVYKEGDGLIIYFILADRDGQMTTCDGEASIEIRHVPTDWDEIENALDKYAESIGLHPKYLSEYGRRQALEKAEKILLSRKYPIKKENFIKTKIGQAPFQQDAILYSFGRIPYDSIGYDLKNQKGKAKLILLGPGKLFEAEETFYF